MGKSILDPCRKTEFTYLLASNLKLCTIFCAVLLTACLLIIFLAILFCHFCILTFMASPAAVSTDAELQVLDLLFVLRGQAVCLR